MEHEKLNALRGKTFTIHYPGKHVEVRMVVKFYLSGLDRCAIIIVETQSNQIHGTLTVNVPDEDLENNQVFVKTYGENVQLAKDAFATGWFKEVRSIRQGFVTIPLWEAV